MKSQKGMSSAQTRNNKQQSVYNPSWTYFGYQSFLRLSQRIYRQNSEIQKTTWSWVACLCIFPSLPLLSDLQTWKQCFFIGSKFPIGFECGGCRISRRCLTFVMDGLIKQGDHSVQWVCMFIDSSNNLGNKVVGKSVSQS